MASTLTRTTIASVAAHGLAAAVLVVVARMQPAVDPLAAIRPANTVDLEITSPPPPEPARAPEPPPVARPEPTPPPVQTPPRPAVERVERAARTVVSTTVTGPVGPVEPVAPVAPVAPAAVVPPTNVPPPMSGLRILTQVGHDVNAAAAAGVMNIGPVNENGPARANIFGGDRGRPTADDVRAIASQPTTAALADSQHMLAAGTVTRDRTIARRAAEEFVPTRTVPNLGAAVMRAPLHSPPPTVHAPGAAEIAATEGLDFAHAQSFTMATGLVTIPTPPYHLVRADVEVVQDASGAVVSAQIVRPSGVAGFDDAAMRAIRAAIPEATAGDPGGARRTRWAFEVSNAASVGARVIGGGNEGWTMLGDEVEGMRLRMRIRVVSRGAL